MNRIDLIYQSPVTNDYQTWDIKSPQVVRFIAFSSDRYYRNEVAETIKNFATKFNFSDIEIKEIQENHENSHYILMCLGTDAKFEQFVQRIKKIVKLW